MIGNLKLASSMTLIRRLGSPTYWRDLRDHPASRIFEMLPWNWKAARLAIAICIIHLSPLPDQPAELLRRICACNARRILLTAFN
jgi:hypothetical protein